MSKYMISDIRKLLDKSGKVILHGLPGVGKTHLALELSRQYKVCLYFDCEMDGSILVEMTEAAKISKYRFGELIRKYSDVDPFMVTDLLFVIDNIDVSEIFASHFFQILNEYGFKILMTMRAANKFLKSVIEQSDIYVVYPRSYREFISVADGIWPEEVMLAHINTGRTIPDMIHQHCTRLLDDYLIYGGMPESCKAYINEEQIEEEIKYIHDKLNYYVLEKLLSVSDLSDSCKYQCRQVVNSVFEQVLGDNYNRFIVSRIREGVTFNKYQEAIDFLVENHFLIRLNDCSGKNNFKLFFYDCGMLVSTLLRMYNKRNTAVDQRKILHLSLENFIVQELICNGYKISYWKSQYTAVVDVVLNINNINIALKLFSDDDMRDKSLSEFEKAFPESLVLKISRDNVKISEKKIYLPAYAISCIRSEKFIKLIQNIEY